MITIIGIIILIIGIVLLWHASKITNEKKTQIRVTERQLKTLNSQLAEKQTAIVQLQKQIEDSKQKLFDQQKESDQYIRRGRARADIQLAEYNEKIENQKAIKQKSFNDFSMKIDIQTTALKQELKQLQDTKLAANEAQLRQEQIKQDKQNYCLIPSKEDLADIEQLEKFKTYLHKPRILSMLIWQTYYQPLAKKQFPHILGTTSIVTGIYRITNQTNGLSYVGQAVDIDKRWKEHCKCGLGIDTPPGNKLYQAINKDGLQNFSFEVLQVCDKAQLDDKESFYIKLYLTNKIGYNSNKGAGKNEI